ncbi:hypothetical protein F2Q70_00012353 [Brassica cretica]|uniref:Uncharacterized protein n=1 Tax=Brassica cretica TaxID=69181 RepID=A0A8S9M121_BRACR|nr:hypothetical protein F2Q70_00012353 [Brassica cretica]
MAVRLRMKVVLRGVLRNSRFFKVRGQRSELSSRSLPPDDHRSSKTGFGARPRFTFGLRLCDDKSAFVLPVCDFYLIRTDIKSAKCYRLIRLVLSVPKKKGRLVGLGRRARSVPPSAPQPYVDPEVLMDQLKDKDDRIAALEQKMADQEAGWEATRKQNEQMMEMMKRMYPNEQFP